MKPIGDDDRWLYFVWVGVVVVTFLFVLSIKGCG
jgi:hypothetical protein